MKSILALALTYSQVRAFVESSAHFWNYSAHINRLRWHATEYLLPRRIRASNELVKLHVDCGGKRLSGFINIDLNRTRATDDVADVRRLRLPGNGITRIESYHVIEHFTEHDAAGLLKAFHLWLQPGGTLVIECPEIAGAMREYLAGRDERIYSIYGRNRFPGDAHGFGYTVSTLTTALQQVGFRTINSLEPQDYHSLEEPCLRIEAVK